MNAGNFGPKDFYTRSQEDTDWRSQIDSIYSGSEYNELISSGSKLHRTGDSLPEFSYKDLDPNTKLKVLDAIRFPPCPRVSLPEPINKERFLPASDYKMAVRSRRASVAASESLAGLDFLEGMLSTVLEKAIDIRTSILDHGKYVYALPKIPHEDDREYMKTVIPENLEALRQETLELITEMSVFNAEKVDDMIQGEDSSAVDFIMVIKASLLDRALVLKHEITESAVVIDGLVRFVESINNIPSGKICKLDGILTDWDAINKLQEKVVSSNRSLNFASYMISYGLPVCGAVYEYLQSTKSYASTLAITNYALQPGELKVILDFFDYQHQSMRARNKQTGSHFVSVFRSVHKMVICNCGLTDKDCHSLSTKLSKFINLDSLNLRNNRISYSGIASIAATIFERGSNLRCLRLDNNLINTDGALIIAEMLHKMKLLEVVSLSSNPIRDLGLYHILRHTMNRQRVAFNILPRPGKSIMAGRRRRQSLWVGGAAAAGGGQAGDHSEDGSDGGIDDYEEGAGGRGGGNGTDAGEYLLESEESEAEAEEVMAVGQTGLAGLGTEASLEQRGKKLETEQERAYKRKIQKKCFFADYFRTYRYVSGVESIAGASAAGGGGGGGGSSSQLGGRAQGGYYVDDYDDDESEDSEEWIYEEDDQFFMDNRSEYSDTPTEAAFAALDEHYELHAVSLQAQQRRHDGGSASSGGGGGTGASSGVGSVGTGTGKGKGGVAQQAKVVPKIIQMFVRIRLKLVAVNMFLRLLRTECILSSLSVAQCDLTDAAVATMSHALKSNHNITALDASDNPLLLTTFEGCHAFAGMIGGSALRTLSLNRCGMRDKGFVEILRAVSACPTLRSLEASRNHIGPTGANWIATANKHFYVDLLDISGGFHVSAPFAKLGDAALGDSEYLDDDQLRLREEMLLGQGRRSPQGQHDNEEDEFDDTLSFHDADTFEGEEEEEEEDGDGYSEEGEGVVRDRDLVGYDEDDVHGEEEGGGGEEKEQQQQPGENSHDSRLGTVLPAADGSRDDINDDDDLSAGRFSQNDMDYDDEDENDAAVRTRLDAL